MKSMEDLKIQFEKEESVWKSKMDFLSEKHKKIVSEITDDLPVSDVLVIIDKAMIVCKEMSDLDSDHKKFLLKWIRKMRRCAIRETVRNFIKILFL